MLTRIAAASMAVLFTATYGHAQAPCFDYDVGTDLMLGDDSTAQGLALGFTFNFGGVAYTDVCVCSNGFIWFGPTSVGGGDYTPTEPELLNGAPRLVALWTDWNPAAIGSGHVYFNTFPAGGGNPARAIITWANVFEYGNTTPCSFQITLDSTSRIHIVYDNNVSSVMGGVGGGGQVMVGASPGGGATPNPVTFAPRPLLVTQDTFHELIPTPTPGLFPYANVRMHMIPTVPGYIISDHVCTPNTLPLRGTYTKIGQGCPLPAAVYESFDNVNNAFDLDNRSFRFVPLAGGGYTMQQPGTAWFGGFANNLNAGDNTTHTVNLPFAFPMGTATLNTIVVSSNGFVWLSPINGGSGPTPQVPIFLSSLPRIAGVWTDLIPGASGSGANGAVYADLDAGTGNYVVTWSNVGEEGVTPPVANTFQIALHSSGAFEIRYQSVAHAHPTRTAVAGFSAGGTTVNPGPTDLSAVTSKYLGSGTPLDLSPAAGSLPSLGHTVTTVISNLPTTAGFAVLMLSFNEANPPISLNPFGGTDCLAYANLFAPTFNIFLFPGGSATASFGLPVPLDVGLAGTTVIAQAAAPATVPYPLGFKLSNGGRMVVGL